MTSYTAIILVMWGASVAPNVVRESTASARPPSAELKVDSAPFWVTLAVDESSYCLANTTSSSQNVSGSFIANTTMLKHYSPTGVSSCTTTVNYGEILLLRNNTTGVLEDLMLEDYLDKSGNQTFQSEYAYYIPIVNTSINSVETYNISCPHPTAGCSVSLLGGAGPSGGGKPPCTYSEYWQYGWIADAFVMNNCATQAVGANLAFFGFIIALVGGAPTGGIAVAIGGVLSGYGLYMLAVNSWGGSNGVWIGLLTGVSCHWSWWTYVCITIATKYAILWYVPVWTPLW